MPTVSEELRRELLDRVCRLSPDERVRLALRLGDEDVEFFTRAHGVNVHEARRQFERSRAVGRLPSCANRAAPPPA